MQAGTIRKLDRYGLGFAYNMRCAVAELVALPSSMLNYTLGDMGSIEMNKRLLESRMCSVCRQTHGHADLPQGDTDGFPPVSLQMKFMYHESCYTSQLFREFVLHKELQQL